MARFFARSALALSALFTAAVLIINMQPRATPEFLWYLSPPPDCPAPCFMGVRAGISPAGEAISLLESRGWTGHVSTASFESGIEFFTWSGQHPGIVPVWEWASLGVEDNIVQSLTIPTRLALGDIVLLYGPADWWSKNGAEAYAGYRQEQFAARFSLHVRHFRTFRRFYLAPVTLHYVASRTD